MKYSPADSYTKAEILISQCSGKKDLFTVKRGELEGFGLSTITIECITTHDRIIFQLSKDITEETVGEIRELIRKAGLIPNAG